MVATDECGKAQRVTLGIKEWVSLAGLCVTPACLFGGFLVRQGNDVAVLKSNVEDLKADIREIKHLFVGGRDELRQIDQRAERRFQASNPTANQGVNP